MMMAEIWSGLMEIVIPAMLAAIVWGQRMESQRSGRLLTQQAVHETQLKHIDRRLSRLENSEKEG